jgi:hypothetical protein
MKKLLSIIPFLFSSSIFAANVTLHESGKGCTLSGAFIEGDIEAGDLKKFQNVVSTLKNKYGENNCKNSNTIIRINSRGGNVDEALLIGREIRKNSFGVLVLENSQCLSSCVFILASGVNKMVMGTVGIHRPYFTYIQEGKTADEIRSMRDSLSQRIKSYLNYMDVPESLLDEMLSYPPEKLKVLSAQDLIKFRLTGADATQDEIDTASQANFYNLTSAEYRKRYEEASAKCSYLFSTNTSAEKIIKCFQPTVLKISESEFNKRYSKANSTCVSSNITERTKCRKSILVENR